MIRKFFIWFIVFGLSFLLENLGFTEQGIAFFCLHLCASCITIIVLILAGERKEERIEFPLILVGIYILSIAIILLATWGATKLFNVDFWVTYQIMTFGQCLCISSKYGK